MVDAFGGTGELPLLDTLPDFSKSSAGKSGGFKLSGGVFGGALLSGSAFSMWQVAREGVWWKG